MQADSNPPFPEDSPAEGVTTTATYGGQTFHLFQVVRIRPRPLPGDWPRCWMVVDLDDGVTVATAEFDEMKHYGPANDEFDKITPITENGTPVYGY
jgi:hypothetical protein